MAFDPKCHELAEYFLSDEPPSRRRPDELAQHIQDAIETWLQVERDHEADAEEYPDNGPTDPWETSGPGSAA